ncbi:protein regulator of cytokinesis 1-like [Pseudomyrmex gracilis]|uniref:protein regulator of cytokinesis 1-like n=1 Tax=Pseudomyrmex gracilis TaxID=219809 RepID=UPI0009951411|nr:protein regulator of cytokinesis 1-like [Pseudomyrmex gracilis]
MSNQPEWKPIVQKTVAGLEQTFEELQKTWEDIGCTENVRELYYEQAHEHIMDLLHDMVIESQTKKQQLAKSIEDLWKKTKKLYTELQLEMELKSYDHISLSDVRQMLERDVQKLEDIKEERKAILDKLLAKEHEICEKLGAKKLDISTNPLPTDQEIESFKLYLQSQENEKIRLESIFADTRSCIIKIMHDLDISPSSSFEQLIYNNPESFVLSENNMTKLIELKNELEAEVEERKHRVEKMKKDLLMMWKYIDEPADVCETFLQSCSGYSTGTINALNAEIKRCKEKQKENIFKYVTTIRYEIMHLWDLCRYSETEKSTFAPFHSNTFTEDLVTLHELEVERLRKFYDGNRAIFELLDQREKLMMKIKEILQWPNNPDRYHNRGGKLLIEEKERKVIQKKLPKIEKELEQLVNEYEKKHNKPFTIYGTTLENVLAETWQNINQEVETIKKARKEGKDKSIKKSPLNISKPGTSQLSIHRGATPLHLSKRKLFTPSPNSSAKKRNKTSDKKPTVTVSKVRRSGKFPKNAQKHRSSRGGEKSKKRESQSLLDTTYNQFQGHMTNREELHSSMIPDQVLKTSTKLNIVKTPVRTPAKPLRKNLAAARTPVTRNSAKKLPLSPRTPLVNTPRLATVQSNLNFLF